MNLIVQSTLYIALMIYFAFFLKIFLQSLPGIFYLRPLYRWLIFLFIEALFWPKEIIQYGIKKFVFIHFTGIQPWAYDRQRFEKSKRKKVYEDAIYFIYRTRSFECNMKELGLPSRIETLLNNKQANVAFIVSWLPEIKKYNFMCQRMSGDDATINLESLPYLLDRCDENGLLTLDECLIEIKKYGVELPQEMVSTLKIQEDLQGTVKSISQIQYYDSYWFSQIMIEG